MSSFTPAGSSGVPQAPVSLEGATTPTNLQISMTTAGSEYSFTLPIGTKQYKVLLNTDATFTIAYSSGGIESPIPRWCFHAEGGLLLTAPTIIYIKSTSPSQTAYVTVWT